MSITIRYNLPKIIEEIKFNFDNQQYFTALSSALILPDICSKIETKLYLTICYS